jgi:pimeloyl-ACP methyl ester carboxylesterase
MSCDGSRSPAVSESLAGLFSPGGSARPARIDGVTPAQPASGGLVIALPCSGAGAGQWRQLGEVLGAAYALTVPEHYGGEQTGPWTGEHAFGLADEAARTLALIDGADCAVHLVGHSYGGSVALHAALLRPRRIASLTLYEPSAFHLLRQLGDAGAAALAEITTIAREAARGVLAGDYRWTAASLVDYWGGNGAWSALLPEQQRALTRWAPKAPLDFAALIEEPTRASAYAGLRVPVLLIRGEHAPAPTRLVAETLAALLPDARLAVIAGAGHMGPFTHRDEVNARIVWNLTSPGGIAASRDRNRPRTGGRLTPPAS